MGRSLLARLASAADASIGIALAAVLSSLAVGTALGLVAGYFGGIAGALIMRISDIIMGFPTLLVALARCRARSTNECATVSANSGYGPESALRPRAVI